MQKMTLIFLILGMLLITACDLVGSGEETGTTTQTPLLTTPDVTPIITSTPGTTTVDNTTTITTTQPTANGLIIWIPPVLNTRVEAGAGTFSDQLLAFSANHQDLDIKVELKPVSGDGGILSYLRTGSKVAPEILPDLVALPSDQLAKATAEGLIYPLDDAINPTLLNDLYPAALALAKSGDELMGYPFALTNLSHLVYKQNVITSTVPSTWGEFISDEAGDFIFPAAGQRGAVLLLQFYLAAGGSLSNEAGQTSIDIDTLTFALDQLRQGRNTDFISPNSSNLRTVDETWQFFLGNSPFYGLTTSDQFLQHRPLESPPAFATIPGLENALPPLVDGWIWVVTDPAQKTLVVDLIATLMADINYSEWSLQSRILPSRRQGFSQWLDEPYTSFIQQELELAQPFPTAATSALLIAFGDAVFDVISLAQSPQAAAEQVAATLQP